MGTKASKSLCSYEPLINISSMSSVSSHLQLHDSATSPTCDTNHTIDLCVNVICNQNKEFNCNFNLLVPYRNDYNLDHLMDDIMHNVHKVHQVVKFTVSNICKNSFTEKELKPTNKNWSDLNKLKIIDYSKLTIIDKGIYICTDIAVYEHKVGVIECQYMLNSDNTLKSISECPIYSAIKYQYQYSKDNLNHMIECNHYNNQLRDKPVCKFAEACYAYQRIINGASTLKDQCHIKLYRHPIRIQKYTVSDQIQELSFNKERKENVGLYQPRENEYDKENGYLGSLIQELIQNGYEENLFLNHSHSQMKISSITDYPIMNVVKDRMYCVRHKRMGSPLNQSEMLAVIIYTGSDAVYDLCKSQRNGNYQKWKWLDYCLYNAILKLSEREHGCYEVYTGFSRMKMSQSVINNGYFKTYVSTSWFKDVAMEFVDRNGMIMVIDAKFREDNICCDVSWISKFPDENEVLIARSVDGANNFKCKLLENDQYIIQTVKLSKQEELNTDVVSEMTHILDDQIVGITESDVADLFDTAHGAAQPPQNSVLTCAGGDTDDSSHSKSSNTSSRSSNDSNQTNDNPPSDNKNNNDKNNNNHNGGGNGGRGNGGRANYDHWIVCNNPMCSMLIAEKDKIIAEQSHQILSLWQQNEQLLSQIQSLNVSQPISISSMNNNAPKEEKKINKTKRKKLKTHVQRVVSYLPAESVRARGNIVIPKSLTLQIIPERIQENYPNVYQFLDICTALQTADNVSEYKSDDEFKVVNYNFHDAKSKEKLYCIIQKRNARQGMKWEMRNELFTGMQINQKYGIQLHDLPTASRLNEKFKTFPNHQKIIKMLLMKKEERGKLFSTTCTQWHKVDIFQQINNKSRVTLSLRKPEFITRLREFAVDIDYDDICLIPILMFVGLNYRIEHLWIVRIDKNLPVDIAISFIYNQKKNTVQVIGIYIDKYRIQKQHKLVSPQHETECKCLDNFQSKIHCLSIGNPDDSLNRLNDLQKRYENLQKECEELRGYRNDTISYSTSTSSQLSTSISISLSSSHVT